MLSTIKKIRLLETRRRNMISELNSSKVQTQKRVESNAKRREAKAVGKNIANKDYDHAVKRFVSVKTNRGRKGEGNR